MNSQIKAFVLVIVLASCVDRIDTDHDAFAQGDFLVEGYISDQPGPYTIRLAQPTDLKSNVLASVPVSARKVTIMDDAGESEDLATVEPGLYTTSANGIRGQVGRKYHVRIELLTGEVFESAPELLRPVGDVLDVRAEFVSDKPLTGPTEYGFNVTMDAENEEGFVRWRFTGTYMVETFPELKQHPECSLIPAPAPCSGQVWDRETLRLIYVGECTCCFCWVDDTDAKPNLSDERIVTNGRYQDVPIGYVPFDRWRFHFFKYMIKVEQMSLTEEAFAFWKIIRDQKEATSDLFQPAFGRLKTNFTSANSPRNAIGFFYATAIRDQVLFLSADDATLPVPPFDLDNRSLCIFQKECDLAWVNASRTPPKEWE
ncbi:MAG: DUF4249 family protein [Cyclobacteriaceae bacterium]